MTTGSMAAAVAAAVHETAGRQLGRSPTSYKTPPVGNPGNGHERDCKRVRCVRVCGVRVGESPTFDPREQPRVSERVDCADYRIGSLKRSRHQVDFRPHAHIPSYNAPGLLTEHSTRSTQQSHLRTALLSKI